ncbi:DUF3306 domain-containing protein [Paracoccus saliphilus]|uniref:DUF3306 domain-containing protein n=1 Tax=Paracoccus saliphilus TaxID=405559 RepID=A0AA46A3W4_9RHOB|nr:DUF3306 domain-containing protein [Paracoccus saliphilus]WCR03303.1 DUF3306 domain-containing protein [Paracoccus saliphilus]SIS51061.1 Protein of unknown function [Paracoccus saliphilus]
MSDFWARRKAAVAAEARAEDAVTRAAEQAAQEAQLAERSDEELLQDLGLPAPEAIDNADTVRRYLRAALPQRLKQQALRRLWTLNPVLANLDGLVDYADDFTASASASENFRTSYQVGKGLMAHVEAMAASRDATEKTSVAHASAPTEKTAITAQEALPEDSAYRPPEKEAAGPSEGVTSPRRMRFSFEETAHG